MKIALAQINPKIGDFDGNARLILEAAARAREMGAEVAVFPELAMMGYPPRDLVDQAGFVEAGLEALAKLAKKIALPALVGFVSRNETGKGRPLRNSAAMLCDGRINSVHHKTLLPTYDVFDEDRYFEPGPKPDVATSRERAANIAVTICEDHVAQSEGDLGLPLSRLIRSRPHWCSQGARGNSQPLGIPLYPGQGKDSVEPVRRNLIRRLAQNFAMPLVYVNQVGGNDELDL